jgi:methylglyoxal synthase
MEQVEPKKQKRKIALVAHDSQIDELLSWASFYHDFLGQYELYATGATVKLLSEKLHLPVTKFQCDPINQKLNSFLEIPVDFLVFFWVAAEALPDDPDIKALLHLATLGNVPIAGNRAAADFMFPLHLASIDSESISREI